MGDFDELEGHDPALEDEAGKSPKEKKEEAKEAKAEAKASDSSSGKK